MHVNLEIIPSGLKIAEIEEVRLSWILTNKLFTR